MSVIPASVRRSTRVDRLGYFYYYDLPAMNFVAGGEDVVVDRDPATGHHTTPGTSKSSTVYTDDFEAFGNRAEFRVSSMAQADVQGWYVRSRYQNYLRIFSKFENGRIHAESEGYARAERDYQASQDICPVSGTCSVDTQGLLGASIPLPARDDSVGLKMIARAIWGSGESYIQADWEYNEERWRVDYQFFYISGSQTLVVSRRTYYVDGLAGLNHETDKIHWSYMLPYQGNEVRCEAFCNKWSWLDNWWDGTPQSRGSRYVLTENGIVDQAKEGFLQHEARTVVDSTYQQRAPYYPRSS